MKLTLKSYYYFDDKKGELGDSLNRPESWDVLRMREDNGPFSIPNERESWQEICLSNTTLRLRAKDIVKLLKTRFNCIHSFGVGVACLEFLIKKEDPSFQLKCSDFASRGVERLKEIFVEAAMITHFDMINGDWCEISPHGICLLHRVDRELNDEQWRTVLKKIKYAGIKNILFIPSEMATLKRILHQQIKYIIFKLLGKKMTFNGFMRTKERLISLLTESFDIDQVVNIHDLPGFLLTAKKA